MKNCTYMYYMGSCVFQELENIAKASDFFPLMSD